MHRIQKIKPYVIQIMAMNLSEDESIKYLDDRGFKISPRYLYKIKKQIKESRFDRLHLIAKTGFIDSHLERVDTLLLVQEEMWKCYRNKDYKAMDALLRIAELQTYISPFMEASKWIMEESIRNDKQEKPVPTA